MSERDTGRAAFYAAEKLVHNLFDRAGTSHTASIGGTTLTLPAEAKFASVASITRYVGDVLAMPSVRRTFERADVPVTVRARRGHRAAEYRTSGQPGLAELGGEIAIPDSAAGTWALRELVVLHELAHHLDASGGPAHGRGFVDTLITLVGLVLGPEAEFAYRVLLSDAGVR